MPAPIDNASVIASIAAQHLGPPPGAPAAPPGAPQMPPGPPPAPPAPPKADQSPTDMERAQAKVAPADPSGGEAATDVKFIKVGDREYTESQLAGTLARYPQANAQLQMNKPLLDLAKQITDQARAQGYDPKPDEVAGLVDAALKAYMKNPTMGNKAPSANDTGGAKPAMSGNGDGDDDDQYAKWEKENAVKLPPGLRETAAQTKAMSDQIAQMMGMFQQLIQGGAAGQNATAQAEQHVQQAQAMQGDAVTKMITTNLNQAFANAGLDVASPQSRADFQMFAAQRGYDFPDFVDPAMTATVVADYKASKDAPEMTRLREIMSRRQAFTGSAEGAPGAGGAPGAPAGDPMLASLISNAMSKRGM